MTRFLLVLAVLLLAGCADATGPQPAALSTTAGAGVPGELPPLVLCWPDQAAAPLTGLPWCGDVH